MSFSDEGARQPGKLVSLAHNKNTEAGTRLPGLRRYKRCPLLLQLFPQAEGE